MNPLTPISCFMQVARQLIRRTLLILPLAVITGSLVALFLWLLEAATQTRWQHPALLYALPLGGIGIHLLYRLWGRDAERGNNLIIDEIHEPGGGVPARMAPLVLLTTILTHLFGGSAGREGTAVQIGGSMAGLMGRWLRLGPADLRILLMSGIAAGFGAVFGTPVAGAVFALEVIAIGRIEHEALWPCFAAAVLADRVCHAWGIHHTHYLIATPLPSFDVWLLLKALLSGVLFGLAGLLFASLTHGIRQLSTRLIRPEWLIPVVGGLLIILLALIPGHEDYLGLGVTARTPHGVSIVQAFHAHGTGDFSWAWKLLFTAITLGMGFKGGEVTPLFFIGATLGNVLAGWMGMPVDLAAGLGFIAVFAGATNTPLACTLMGVELFGGAYLPYYAPACFAAYFFSGQQGIYTAQRTAFGKHP